jgi:hypothetical protein
MTWHAALTAYFLLQIPLGILVGKWIKWSQPSEFDAVPHSSVERAGLVPPPLRAGATLPVTT